MNFAEITLRKWPRRAGRPWNARKQKENWVLAAGAIWGSGTLRGILASDEYLFNTKIMNYEIFWTRFLLNPIFLNPNVFEPEKDLTRKSYGLKISYL